MEDEIIGAARNFIISISVGNTNTILASIDNFFLFPIDFSNFGEGTFPLFPHPGGAYGNSLLIYKFWRDVKNDCLEKLWMASRIQFHGNLYKQKYYSIICFALSLTDALGSYSCLKSFVSAGGNYIIHIQGKKQFMKGWKIWKIISQIDPGRSYTYLDISYHKNFSGYRGRAGEGV